MIPLVDMHCHLLACLDDGPRSDKEALDMCRLAYREGTRMVAATAHQNDRWSEVTPARIRDAARRLAQTLGEAHIPLTVFPSAEVTMQPDIESAWRRGDLLSIADGGGYLLLELPNDLIVAWAGSIRELRAAGVRPVLAHPERNEELLHESERLEQWIRAGCLVQVSASSVTSPPSPSAGRHLKSWFQRGMVHFVGSDGHSPTQRPPRMAGAYHQIRRWAGSSVADRVCSTNGLAVMHGIPIQFSLPEPRSRWRFW